MSISIVESSKDFSGNDYSPLKENQMRKVKLDRDNKPNCKLPKETKEITIIKILTCVWTSCNNSNLVIIINTRCEIIADKLLHTNYHIYIFRTLDTSLFDVGNALRKDISMQCFAL